MTLASLTVLLALANFAIGGIPFGLLLGRLKGIDVRKAGSGNIGAANVGRLLGRPWGIAVFALDAAKGLVPTVVAGIALGRTAPGGEALPPPQALCWLFAGFCAVLGHNYSPYLGFRGGKGVATSLGVALGVYPYLTVPALLAFLVWLAGVGLTRMSSVGSLCAAISFPLFVIVLSLVKGVSIASRWPFLAFAGLTCVSVILRHRANIRRILSGTEARMGTPAVAGAQVQGKREG